MRTAGRSSSRAPASRLGQDDRGVSEVVGFIFMFAIAFVVLSLSMILVSDRLTTSSRANQRTVFAEAGSAVATAVQETVSMADRFPNASYERRVTLPEGLSGAPFRVTVTNWTVYVNSTARDINVTQRYGGFDLPAEGLAFTRTSTSSRHLVVVYRNCLDHPTSRLCIDPFRAGNRTLVVREGST